MINIILVYNCQKQLTETSACDLHPKSVSCKTNTIPILMHKLSISTNEVSSVMLRLKKKIEIRKPNCHKIEPNLV